MTPDSKIYIAGHTGLVGSAVARRLTALGYGNLVMRSRRELDLTDQRAVNDFISLVRPNYMFICAGRVGGIRANDTYRADFIRDNLLIAANLIDAAYRSGIGKSMVLGSSCIYPRLAQQPLKEEYLLTGALELTNQPYAVAKISGITMAQAYRAQFGMNVVSVSPANTYGPGDNFDPDDSHVIPAMLRKFHQAKVNNEDSVVIWGSGDPVREFLFVDDLADALIFLMAKYDKSELINAGSGEGVTIRDLARAVAKVVGFNGRIVQDTSKPDGMPKKVLDTSKLRELGWQPKHSLQTGLERTYEWYRARHGAATRRVSA